MTDKELKHLNRADLVEIIYALQKSEQQLREELAAAREQLASREIKISEAGSIAQAAVELNGVLEAAQAAADQYLEQVHAMNAETETKCFNMLEEARRCSEAMTQRANAEVQAKHEQADREIAEKWEAFQRKTQEVLKAHSELSDLLKRS